MSLQNIITSRRSVRRFLPDSVDEARLVRLVEAARWAPSPHNSQPWRFAIVRHGPARTGLGDAMADRWRKDLASHGENDPRVLRLVENRRKRLLEAPGAIVACLTSEGLDDYPDEERRNAEWLTAEQSLGAAVQNLLLAAHDDGLGACWICAPAFCPDTVKAALDLPESWEPRALVLAGIPEVVPPVRERRSLDSFILVR